MTGISDCTYGLALPVQESLAQALGRSLPLVLGTDNDAARQAVMAGHSRRLAYVRRHQRVSLGALHDTFGPGNADGNRLVREPSTTMPVDVLTKPLPEAEHWACLGRLGMGRYRDGPPREMLERAESGAVIPLQLEE